MYQLFLGTHNRFLCPVLAHPVKTVLLPHPGTPGGRREPGTELFLYKAPLHTPLKFLSLMYLSPVLTCCSLFLFSMLYLSPVLACCSLFLFMLLYVIPVLPCCSLFLFMLMYVIPVCHDVPYSRLSCSMLFCCMLIWCIQFFKKAWCTLFLYCILYLNLMYAFPVFPFLTDVPYSDVSFSAPPSKSPCL